jgi:hypothetical protein
MISDLLDQLRSLTSTIRKSKAVNVNNKSIKEAAVAVGNYYFRDCRGEARQILNDGQQLAELDEDWQRLIRFAQGNNAKKSYLAIVKSLLKQTTELTVAAHVYSAARATSEPTKLAYSQAEEILLATLDSLVPTAAQSYRQGLYDLNNGENRFSYRGTASEFREALRETLDTLASDENIKKQPWFRQEPNCSGPTMKQKVRFILASRGKNRTQRSAAEKTVDVIESLCGEVARAVYDRASLSTHLQTTKTEVGRMKRYLDAVLFDVLEIGQSQ